MYFHSRSSLDPKMAFVPPSQLSLDSVYVEPPTVTE